MQQSCNSLCRLLKMQPLLRHDGHRDRRSCRPALKPSRLRMSSYSMKTTVGRGWRQLATDANGLLCWRQSADRYNGDMSDDDSASLIKAGIEQLMRPIQELLDKLLGPAATAVGDSLGDSAKVWRFKRQLRLLNEVKRMIEDSDRDIKPVATRLFFPVLQAASIEDDDDMQSRWAALIANEAVDVGSVHPSFIEILRQLAPQDARLLDMIYDYWVSPKRDSGKNIYRPWIYDVTWAGNVYWDEHEEERRAAEDAFDSLLRLGLVQQEYKLINRYDTGSNVQAYDLKLKEEYGLSEVSVRFVAACRAPKRKLDSE